MSFAQKLQSFPWAQRRGIGEGCSIYSDERCGVCSRWRAQAIDIANAYHFLTRCQPPVHPIQEGTERNEKRERPHQVASGRSQGTRGCARATSRANRPRLSSRYWLDRLLQRIKTLQELQVSEAKRHRHLLRNTVSKTQHRVTAARDQEVARYS